VILGGRSLLYLPEHIPLPSGKGLKVRVQTGRGRAVSPVLPRLASVNAEHFRRMGHRAKALNLLDQRDVGRHHTKTPVVVEVVDGIVVAVGAAGVPMIVGKGTATQHAALIGRPCRNFAARSLYRRNLVSGALGGLPPRPPTESRNSEIRISRTFRREQGTPPHENPRGRRG